MANPDGLDGICGDREMVDSLYLYYKLKKKLSKSKPTEDESIPETKQRICLHYLHCIKRCFSQISCIHNYDKSYRTYLDYLRWNMDIIENQLAEFEGELSLESYHSIISEIRTDLRRMHQECFSFSATEHGIANEFLQAYSKICNNEDFRPILVKQAGRLFLNYVNNLVQRCYIKKIDREDVTFAQLEYESSVLTEKLSAIPDADLAKCVSDAFQAYADFRSMDESARIGQDLQMKHAFKFAHERATENALQFAIRKINESIKQVLVALGKRTQELWDISVSMSPILNPAMAPFVSNPLRSAKEVWNWAKNPWNPCALVFGGICLGVMPAIIIPAIAIGYLYLSIGPFIEYHLITRTMKKATQDEIDKKEEEKLHIMQRYKMEGEEISMEVIYEEHRREVLRQARERAESDVQEMRKRNEQIAENSQRQFDGMGVDVLRSSQSQLNQDVKDLTQHLNETREKSGRRRKEIQEISVDVFSVMRGRDAAARLLERNAGLQGLCDNGNG